MSSEEPLTFRRTTSSSSTSSSGSPMSLSPGQSSPSPGGGGEDDLEGPGAKAVVVDDGPGKRPKVQVSHTNSLPGVSFLEEDLRRAPNPKSLRTRSFKQPQQPKQHQHHQSLHHEDDSQLSPASVGLSSSRWSFGSMAKAVGTGVTAFGSGVVQGTKAVGSGVVQGTKAVGSGVVQGTMVVGSGVVEGSMAAGRATIAAGKGVITAGEIVGSAAMTGATVVGSAAVTGVSAVGTATVSAGTKVATVSASAVSDTTKWVREQSGGSFGPHDLATQTHTVLPGQSLAEVAELHGVSLVELIQVNQLPSRHVRAGRELAIPSTASSVDIFAAFQSSQPQHPNETYVCEARLVTNQQGLGSGSGCRPAPPTAAASSLSPPRFFVGSRQASSDEAQPQGLLDGVATFSLKQIEFHLWGGGCGGGTSSGSSPQDVARPSPTVASPTMDHRHVVPDTDPFFLIQMSRVTCIKVEFSPDEKDIRTSLDHEDSSCGGSGSGGVPALLPAESKNDYFLSGPEVRSKRDPAAATASCTVVEVDMEGGSHGGEDHHEDNDEGPWVRITVTGVACDSSTELADLGETAVGSKCYQLEVPVSESVSLMAYLELWFLELLQIEGAFARYVAEQLDVVENDDLDGPNLLDPSGILDPRTESDLHLQLPPKFKHQPWRLAYTTSESGFSLQNLYRSLEVGLDLDGGDPAQPHLLAIMDTEGNLFGAFLTCRPSLTDSFVGTGKSWLFAVDEDHKFHVFHWTGKNDYFFRGQADCMVIGASDGMFGIQVDGDLHRGRIQPCSTFQNWPLAERDFAIRCLECWRFTS